MSRFWTLLPASEPRRASPLRSVELHVTEGTKVGTRGSDAAFTKLTDSLDKSFPNSELGFGDISLDVTKYRTSASP